MSFLMLRSSRLKHVAAAVVALGSGAAMAVIPVAADSTPTPSGAQGASAIGGVAVFSIAASPEYRQTGLVVAAGSGQCPSGGTCVWVSHDGGASWHRATNAGFQGTTLSITVDGKGNEVLYTEGSNVLQRSDDYAESWRTVGTAGTPSIEPSYAKDGGVAVAAHKSADYVLRASGQQPLAGSGGALADLSFAFAPSYPSGGSYSPALLAGANLQTGLPVIQRCGADLHCTGNTQLAGSVTFSAPGMNLVLSGDYGSSGIVFARTGRGIYRSSDGGGSFALLPIGDASASATATPGMAVAPGFAANGQVKTAYAAVLQIFQDKTDPKKSHSAGGIYRSTDGGLTWSRPDTTSPLVDGALSVATAPDGRLFASYTSGQTSANGLLCSTDQGVTWQPSCPHVGNWSPKQTTGSGSGTGACGSSCPGTAAPSASGGQGLAAATASAGGGAAGDPANKPTAVGTSPSPGRSGGSSLVIAIAAVAVAAGLGALAWWRRRRPAGEAIE